MEIADAPWKHLTDAAGTITSLARAGAVDAVAWQPGTTDTGVGSGTLASADDAVALDIALGAQPPRVVRILPADTATSVSVLSTVEVDFSEPIASASVDTDAIQASYVDDAEQTVAVEGATSLSLSRRRLTFVPDGELPAGQLVTVTISDGLTDDDGTALTGDRVFTFTTASPNARSTVSARLTSYVPGSQDSPCSPYDPATVSVDFDPTGDPTPVPGFDADDLSVSCVVGAAGVAEPNIPVILINEGTGQTVTVTSRANGSFKSFIRAAAEDLLEATFVNRNGTDVSVPLERQLFDDGRVGLYAAGGVVEADNPLGGAPLEVIVEAGAVPRRTVFRIAGQTAQEVVATATTGPAEGALLMGATLETEGDALRAPPDVRFPIAESDLQLPPGITATTAGYLLTSVVSEVIDGQEVVTYEVLDRMKYEEDALATHSFPFDVLLMGVRAYRAVQMAILQYVSAPRAFSGYAVACDTSQLACANRGGTTPPAGRRLPGARVFVHPMSAVPVGTVVTPGALSATTDINGRYAIASPHLTGDFTLRGIHPEFPGRAAIVRSDALERVSDLGTGNAHIIFDTAGQSQTSPVKLTVQHAPVYPLPWVPTSTGSTPATEERALLSVVATHPDGPPNVRVRLENITPLGSTPVSLSSVQRLSPTTQQSSNTMTTYQEQLTVLDDAQLTLRVESWNPSVPGSLVEQRYTITFRDVAEILLINDSSADPKDETGPYVLWSDPSDETQRFSPERKIRVRFSEAVQLPGQGVQSAVLFAKASNACASALPLHPVYSLADDRRTLEVHVQGVCPGGTYDLHIQNVFDLEGNPFSQPTAAGGGASNNRSSRYTVTFTTVSNVGTGPGTTGGGPGPFAQIGRASGAVLHGAYAYAVDTQDNEIERFDMSGPVPQRGAFPFARLSPVPFPAQHPRDVVVIPGWSYVRPTGQGQQVPCQSPHEQAGTLSSSTYGSTQVAVSSICKAENRTLLAIIGGRIGSFGSVDNRGPYLRVLDVTDPASPRFVLRSPLSSDPLSTASHIDWSAPALAFMEFTSPPVVNVVDLQTMIFGQGLTSQQYASMPAFTDVARFGLDQNGDGDYADPQDIVPVPPKPVGGIVGLGYAGLRDSLLSADTTQPILDFAIDGRRHFVGAAMGPGAVAPPSSGQVPASYQSLLDGGRGPGQLPRGQASISPSLPSADLRPDTVGYVSRLRMKKRIGPAQTASRAAGLVDIVDLALWGASSVDGQSDSRLFLFDVEDPLNIEVIGDPEGVKLPKEMGRLEAIEYDPSDPRTIRVVAHNDVAFLDVDLLTMKSPSGPAAHPAINGVVSGVGTGAPATGASSFGVFVSPEQDRVVFTGPRFEFVSFPLESQIVQPVELVDAVKSAGTSSATRSREQDIRTLISRAQREAFLRIARMRTIGTFAANIDKPDVNFHVLMRAPGAAGPTVSLLLAGHDHLGAPEKNRQAGFMPVYAASEDTVQEAKLRIEGASPSPPSIMELVAYRLSDDKGSDLYNVYLSLPFAVTHQDINGSSGVAGYRTVRGRNRPVLASCDRFDVSIDPGVSPDSVLAPFASKVVGPQRFDPGVSISADAFDIIRIKGPNPADYPIMVPGSRGYLTAQNGEFRTQATDLVLPGLRMPIAFTRSYRGQDLYFGPFGEGWDHVYNQKIVELKPEHLGRLSKVIVTFRGAGALSDTVEAGDVLLHNGAGRIVRFHKIPGSSAPPEYASDPLLNTTGWNARGAVWYRPQIDVFDALIKLDGGQFVRVTPDGTAYWYDPNGVLRQVMFRSKQGPFGDHYHELFYVGQKLREIVDRSVPGRARKIRIGYFREKNDPHFEQGLDIEPTDATKMNLIARISGTVGGAGGSDRDILYDYENGRLMTVEGPEPGTYGGSGRHKTTYDWAPIGLHRSGIYQVNDRSSSQGDGSHGQPVFEASGAVNYGFTAGTDPTLGTTIIVTPTPGNVAENMSGGTSSFSNSDMTSSSKYNAKGVPTEHTITPSRGRGAAPSTIEIPEHYAGVFPKLIRLNGGGEIRPAYDEANVNLRSRGNVIGMIRSPRPEADTSVVPGYTAPTSMTRTFRYDSLFNQPEGNQTDWSGRQIFIEQVPGTGDARRIVWQTSPTLAEETMTYDANTGMLSSHTDVDGVVRSWAYDSSTGFMTETRVGSLKTVYSDHTDWGEPRKMSPGSNRGVDQVRGYNDRGDLYQVIEGQRITDVDYDRFGRPTKIVRTVAAGERYTELRTYHPYGALKERVLEAIETDVSGATQDLKWIYGHDDRRRVNSVTFPGGDVQTTIYDGKGRPSEVKYGEIEQRFKYDAYDNLETTERGPSGDVATETRYYDGYERLIRVDDAAGHARTMTYSNDDVVSSRTTYQNTALNGVVDSFVANTIDVMGRVTNWTEGSRATFQLVPEALRTETTGPRGAKVTERWLASGQLQDVTLAEQFGTNVVSADP